MLNKKAVLDNYNIHIGTYLLYKVFEYLVVNSLKSRVETYKI